MTRFTDRLAVDLCRSDGWHRPRQTRTYKRTDLTDGWGVLYECVNCGYAKKVSALAGDLLLSFAAENVGLALEHPRLEEYAHAAHTAEQAATTALGDWVGLSRRERRCQPTGYRALIDSFSHSLRHVSTLRYRLLTDDQLPA